MAAGSGSGHTVDRDGPEAGDVHGALEELDCSARTVVHRHVEDVAHHQIGEPVDTRTIEVVLLVDLDCGLLRHGTDLVHGRSATQPFAVRSDGDTMVGGAAPVVLVVHESTFMVEDDLDQFVDFGFSD